MRELKLKQAGEDLILPFPCLNLMGCYMLAKWIDCENPYRDSFDPHRVLMNASININPYISFKVDLPKEIISIRPINEYDEPVDEVFDQVSEAAMILIDLVDDYHEKFFLRDAQGQYTKEKPTISFPQGQFKSNMRSQIQKALTSFYMRTLWKLKSVLHSHIFKSPFPGFYAPLLPDPSLAIDEVGIPCDIFPMFEGQDALVLRHPVLEWLYRLKPVKLTQMVIGLNPALFDAIGADSDGDQCFVTPIPAVLDVPLDETGEFNKEAFASRCKPSPDSLTISEAMSLVGTQDLKDKRISTDHPANIKSLSLFSMLDGSFCKKMQDKGIRKYNDPIIWPVNNTELWKESIDAAARFAYEKQAIRRADSIRRTLLIVLDIDAETLRSVNCFCSRVTQMALDAGKHKIEFPLDDYSLIFRGRTKDFRGRIVQAAHVNELKEDLKKLDVPNLEDGEFILEQLVKQYPDFLAIGGLKAIYKKYFPLHAMSTIKQSYDGFSTPPELLCLMQSDLAIIGLGNFWF